MLDEGFNPTKLVVDIVDRVLAFTFCLPRDDSDDDCNDDNNDDNDDDDNSDDEDHYSCKSVSFQDRTSRFCMDVDLDNMCNMMLMKMMIMRMMIIIMMIMMMKMIIALIQ